LLVKLLQLLHLDDIRHIADMHERRGQQWGDSVRGIRPKEHRVPPYGVTWWSESPSRRDFSVVVNFGSCQKHHHSSATAASWGPRQVLDLGRSIPLLLRMPCSIQRWRYGPGVHPRRAM